MRHAAWWPRSLGVRSPAFLARAFGLTVVGGGLAALSGILARLAAPAHAASPVAASRRVSDKHGLVTGFAPTLSLIAGLAVSVRRAPAKLLTAD